MLAESSLRNFNEIVRGVEFASMRYVSLSDEHITVRRGHLLPAQSSLDRGVMIFVVDKSGIGYCGTQDLSRAGIKSAFDKAKHWANLSAGNLCLKVDSYSHSPAKGSYRTYVKTPWESVPLDQKVERLIAANRKLGAGQSAADWFASFWYKRWEQSYYDTNGSSVEQVIDTITPMMSATAHKAGIFQTRTFGGHALCAQAGLEHIDMIDFDAQAARISSESERLLSAENCPSEKMDIVLAPDQMILQIHESIGHPLELDRILGDERNYAGTSFVRPEMFGEFKYGSELLNVVFDPTVQGEIASYQFDDEGTPAKPTFLIEKGILKAGIGGQRSQERSGLPGVAASRSVSWNRPPIDRMANLNLLPGQSSLEELIAGVERGVLMKTNNSWSIDDSRNKFQFGCEWGQMIENGELTHVVKSPCYRGISADFWLNLNGVGDGQTYEVLGTPYCGKGEPNQAIGVGHATPACRFRDIDVFGGDS